MVDGAYLLYICMHLLYNTDNSTKQYILHQKCRQHYCHIRWDIITLYIYIYQNNPINFVEIKFLSKIHVDTMKVEHSQGGSVCGCPNNILRYAVATLTIRHSLLTCLCYVPLQRDTAPWQVDSEWTHPHVWIWVWSLSLSKKTPSF